MSPLNLSDISACPGMNQTVLDAIMALEPQKREIVMLACVEAMSPEAIAALLDMAADKVASLLEAGLHEMSTKGCPEEFLARVAPELRCTSMAFSKAQALVSVIAELDEPAQAALEKLAKKRPRREAKDCWWRSPDTLALWLVGRVCRLAKASMRPALAVALGGLIGFGIWKGVEYTMHAPQATFQSKDVVLTPAKEVSAKQVMFEGGVFGSYGRLSGQLSDSLQGLARYSGSQQSQAHTAQGTVSVRETRFFDRPTLTYGVMTENKKTPKGAQGQPTVTYLLPEATTAPPAQDKKH